MTSVSRSAQFAKVQKVLKKHYKAPPANPSRTVIEHMLFACCLENARHEAAEEAFAALVHTFFDWNEVRVTSISELSEVMVRLPDPREAANRIKRVLHGIFEATFNFDLEEIRKKSLGANVAWLEKLDGMTPFTVSYVVQAALGGHSIPIDAGTMAVLRILDLVTDKDVESHSVPGLERAIAKSKGAEFAAMLHELGADFSANAYSPKVREILLEIHPECKDQLPKRRSERAAKKKQEEAAEDEKKKKTGKADVQESVAESKSSPRKKHAAGEAAPAVEVTKKKPSLPAKASAKSSSAEKGSSKPAAPKKRSASEGLSKRKPR